MLFSTRICRLCVSAAIIALLAMQVTVAAYACPYMAAMQGSESMMPANCANGINLADQPNLCKAHADIQSQLKGDQVAARLAFSLAVVAVLIPLEIAAGLSAARAESYALSRLMPDGSPPIFVRHQVFRK